jgi:dTDP-4-amino-4,6-dideoxygalactose transaminase
MYDRALSDISGLITPQRAPGSSHVFHQYTLTLDSEELRNRVRQALAAKGVQSMIYYPRPLHLHPAYRSERFPDGSFPVSEQLSCRVLSLPIHSEMTEAVALEISAFIREACI